MDFMGDSNLDEQADEVYNEICGGIAVDEQLR